MAGKPMSWKWKLLIAFVVISLFSFGFFLSPPGHRWLEKRIVDRYQALPEAERRESAFADSYLTLAWWRGSICQDSKSAMEMYREFCGLPKDAKDDSVFKTFKLVGPLVSPDGKTGWGPLHPRAPEAYYNFILFYDVLNSSQFTQERCWEYYRLFYIWHITYSPDRKPHPNFNKYWPKIKDLGEKSPRGWPPDINKAAPLALPVADETKK
jgi:hypothetical protein